MLYLLLPILVSFGFSGELVSQEEANKNYCKSLIDDGNYKSAGDQILCHEHFDMAPAYLIKCLNFQIEGFPAELDEKACDLYLSDNEDWGPWQDYTPKKEIQELLEEYRKNLL